MRFDPHPQQRSELLRALRQPLDASHSGTAGVHRGAEAALGEIGQRGEARHRPAVELLQPFLHDLAIGKRGVHAERDGGGNRRKVEIGRAHV